MTKVGEGGQFPQQDVQAYQKNLQDNITRFQDALNGYQVASNDGERTHLETLMTQSMDLIQTNVREIKRAGIQKQGEVVESDYERYRQSSSSENLTALEQDLSTLKEYSQLPPTS